MSILDKKCATPGCWHKKKAGYILCLCCLSGNCRVMTRAERKQYEEELAKQEKEAKP